MEILLTFSTTTQILDAAALSEQPFCDERNSKSIDLAINSMKFHSQYLTILLTRACSETRSESILASKQMLTFLPHMQPASENEPYAPIIWQLICCPFTALLTLLREVISNGQGDSLENKEALAAMEILPAYLKHMSVRNALAENLEGIAKVFINHARSAMRFPTAASQQHGLGDPSMPNISKCYLDDGVTPVHAEAYAAGDAAVQPDSSNWDYEYSMDDLSMFISQSEYNQSIDWFSWDSQILP